MLSCQLASTCCFFFSFFDILHPVPRIFGLDDQWGCAQNLPAAIRRDELYPALPAGDPCFFFQVAVGISARSDVEPGIGLGERLPWSGNSYDASLLRDVTTCDCGAHTVELHRLEQSKECNCRWCFCQTLRHQTQWIGHGLATRNA